MLYPESAQPSGLGEIRRNDHAEMSGAVSSLAPGSVNGTTTLERRAKGSQSTDEPDDTQLKCPQQNAFTRSSTISTMQIVQSYKCSSAENQRHNTHTFTGAFHHSNWWRLYSSSLSSFESSSSDSSAPVSIDCTASGEPAS